MLLDAWRGFAGQQEKQVDVRIGRQFAPAITADGDHGDGIFATHVMERADHRIHHRAIIGGGLRTAGPFHEALLDFRAALLKRLLEVVELGGSGVSRLIGQGRQIGGQGLAVEDGTLGHQPSPSVRAFKR